MQLIENKNTDSHLITSVNDNSLVINQVAYQQTCIISNHTIITDLNISTMADLTQQHIQYLLSSNPEIIILGSGTQHIFPDVNLLATIADLDIGLEVMNNKSASRTFNVLVAEDRKVSCLLIV